VDLLCRAATGSHVVTFMHSDPPQYGTVYWHLQEDGNPLVAGLLWARLPRAREPRSCRCHHCHWRLSDASSL